MNYPLWDVPAPGLLIAAVGILHVFISHFAVGGGLFLVLAERKARREQDAVLLGFLRARSRDFVLLTLVAGALTGVGIWLTIGLVQPQAVSALVVTFVWAWAIEWTFFAVEIAAASVYFYGWDRLSPRQHLAVGWVYAASAWASLVVISGILSFMLTSGAWPETHRLADGFFNPTFLPTVALRSAVAAGLAGLYVLFAAAFLGDAELKSRLCRWCATRWIAPAALAVALALVWFLSAAAAADVAVAETLTARDAAPLSVLSGVFAPANVGQPVVRMAARSAIVSAVALLLLALGVAALRPRHYGRLAASLLMLLGLVAMGGGEWVREGLRKPWVIDRYLFVNGIRVSAVPAAAAGQDPFSVGAIDRRGVLASSPWSEVPAGFRPGDPSFERLLPAERAALEAQAGQVVFAVECAACHTLDGHLSIRSLVRGRGVAALETVLEQTARPVASDGRAASWSEPGVRVVTWRGRRMPPFAGTRAEQHALAVYLSRLGGDSAAGLDSPAPPGGGLAAFEAHCSACHGAGAPWPIQPRLRGRSAAELYELIGRLPELREEMPPFSGSENERRALAAYLGRLSAGAGADPGEVMP
ncbi:MAG TPA: c-type cytochrome [Vicinamibacteria bacterium]|nr:c-type cytochrome [Vicinamibacteria bacterium]